MPDIVKILLELVKNNPALLADVLEVIKRILALLEKYPELATALAQSLKVGPPPA